VLGNGMGYDQTDMAAIHRGVIKGFATVPERVSSDDHVYSNICANVVDEGTRLDGR